MIVYLGLGILGWLAISYLTAVAGGWRAVASAYPVHHSEQGERVFWCRASMRSLAHEIVNIVWGEQAMTISAPAIFRFGRPAFTIPYTDMSVSDGRILWVKTVRLRFRKAPTSHLDLSAGNAGGLRELARG